MQFLVGGQFSQDLPGSLGLEAGRMSWKGALGGEHQLAQHPQSSQFILLSRPWDRRRGSGLCTQKEALNTSCSEEGAERGQPTLQRTSRQGAWGRERKGRDRAAGKTVSGPSRLPVLAVVQLLSRVRLFETPWMQHARPPCPSPHSELAQTHIHRVSDAIQPSHPLSSPPPPAFNLSQHQGLFQ